MSPTTAAERDQWKRMAGEARGPSPSVEAWHRARRALKMIAPTALPRLIADVDRLEHALSAAQGASDG